MRTEWHRSKSMCNSLRTLDILLYLWTYLKLFSEEIFEGKDLAGKDTPAIQGVPVVGEVGLILATHINGQDVTHTPLGPHHIPLDTGPQVKGSCGKWQSECEEDGQQEKESEQFGYSLLSLCPHKVQHNEQGSLCTNLKWRRKIWNLKGSLQKILNAL